jgi:hypothetical protein
MRTWVRVVGAVLLLGTAGGARAHEFACRAVAGQILTDEAGLPLTLDGFFVFASGAVASFPIERYPAVIAVSLRLENLAQDPSTVGALENLLAGRLAAGTPTWRAGNEVGAGTTVEVGGTRTAELAFRVDSHEACLALGGFDPEAPACGGSVDARFVVTHEVGSAECTARLLCRQMQEVLP